VEETRPDTGAIVSGVMVFGISYTAGIIAGTVDQGGSGSLAFVPLLGPWLAIGGQDFTCQVEANEASIEECQSQVVGQAAIVATYAAVGVAQILGVSSIIRGLLDRERYWVRQDLLEGRDARPLAWGLFPYASPSSAGLGVRGSF
jgi:hypothetical protein